MAERKPKKITEAPTAKAFTGSLLLSVEEFDYTPDKMLDALGFAKENRPVFRLKPLTTKQRHFIEADTAKMQAEGAIWAKSQGIDIKAKDVSDFYILSKKWNEFSDTDARREIVRSCIVGFNGVGLELFEQAEDGGLNQEIFDRFPTDLINSIEVELRRRTSLNNDEVLGL